MALFKKTEPVVDTQPPREILQEKIESLSTEMHEFKENTEKQIKEICSALNILDGDVMDLKEDQKAAKKAPCSKELENIKQTLESLKLMGRLCIQNKEEIEVLTEQITAHKNEPKKIHSPVKMLN